MAVTAILLRPEVSSPGERPRAPSESLYMCAFGPVPDEPSDQTSRAGVESPRAGRRLGKAAPSERLRVLASVAGPGPCWERPIPRKYASGEIDHNGSITRAGDGAVRGALVQAALTLLTRDRRLSVLKAWGMAVAKRRGLHRAIVAVARKLAIILHRMWIDLGEKHEPRGDVEVQAKNGGWVTGNPLSEKDVMWWPFV